jgi:hypothetical protein
MRKSQRTRTATVAFNNRFTAFTASALKLTSKTVRNRPETALKPIAVKLLPELASGPLPQLLEYNLLFKLRLLPSESINISLSKL